MSISSQGIFTPYPFLKDENADTLSSQITQITCIIRRMDDFKKSLDDTTARQGTTPGSLLFSSDTRVTRMAFLQRTTWKMERKRNDNGIQLVQIVAFYLYLTYRSHFSIGQVLSGFLYRRLFISVPLIKFLLKKIPWTVQLFGF